MDDLLRTFFVVAVWVVFIVGPLLLLATFLVVPFTKGYKRSGRDLEERRRRGDRW